MRRERIGVVAPQHADEAAHLRERAAADLLDRRQHLPGRTALGVERAPLGAGLHDHHRDVVGDRVVQLPRDSRALLDDRLARGDVALPLGELRAPLAIDDHAADEQHHDQRDDGEGHTLVQRPARPGGGGEIADEHECGAGGKPARRRPHGHPVQGAEPGDRAAEDLRVAPAGERDRHRACAATPASSG